MAKDKHPFLRVFLIFFEKVEEHTWKTEKTNEKK